MSRFGSMALCLMQLSGLCASSNVWAWPEPPVGLTGEILPLSGEEPDVEFALQQTTPKKPESPTTSPPNRTQPPAARPDTPPTPPQQPPQPRFNPFLNPQPNQPFLARLSRAPDMFGDSFLSLSALTIGSNNELTLLNLPLAGGSRQFKNEHSRAMPTDRVFGVYHHFHNALDSVSLTNSFTPQDANLDRFTVGFEKTFAEQSASFELRMPFSVPVSMSTPGGDYQTQSAGDLVAILKGLLYADDAQAVALGLAVNIPTGSDLNVKLPAAGNATFTVFNDATHLIPFVAYQAAPTEDFFFNTFLQFDTPTNSNTVRVRDPATSPGETFSVTDQLLMFVDTSFGYWLFRDPDANGLTGLAGLLELHYTTALNRPDRAADSDQLVNIGVGAGRIDALNLTIGLHTEIARSTIIRAGYVTPLRSGNHKLFDSEFTLAVIFRR